LYTCWILYVKKYDFFEKKALKLFKRLGWMRINILVMMILILATISYFIQQNRYKENTKQVKSSQRKWAHPVPKMDKRNNIEIRGRH
jgi:hypothetical protein